MRTDADPRLTPAVGDDSPALRFPHPPDRRGHVDLPVSGVGPPPVCLARVALAGLAPLPRRRSGQCCR